jgi:hypothetical protein
MLTANKNKQEQTTIRSSIRGSFAYILGGLEQEVVCDIQMNRIEKNPAMRSPNTPQLTASDHQPYRVMATRRNTTSSYLRVDLRVNCGTVVSCSDASNEVLCTQCTEAKGSMSVHLVGCIVVAREERSFQLAGKGDSGLLWEEEAMKPSEEADLRSL